MWQFFIPILVALTFAASAQAAPRNCSMQIDFDTAQTVEAWRAVNDGVMGGRSSGGPRFAEGHMIFEGSINTNGGGFSSVRTDVAPGLLSGASGLVLHIKPDERAYKVTFRTGERYRFRRISFQAKIPQRAAGDWVSVFVPFKAVDASIFGRAVRGAQFDKADVREIGFILADGQDGPFRLEIDSIKACTKA